MTVLLFRVGDTGIAVAIGEVGENAGAKLGTGDGFVAQLLKIRLHSRTQQMI